MSAGVVGESEPDAAVDLGLVGWVWLALPAMVGERAADRRIWWETYANVHNQQWNGGYYINSLVPFAGRLIRGEADDEDVRRLAEYSLMFFDVADRPECWATSPRHHPRHHPGRHRSPLSHIRVGLGVAAVRAAGEPDAGA